jgi:hypothetical protein
MKKSPLFNDDGIIINCSTQMLAAEKNPTSVSNTQKYLLRVKVLLNRLDEIKQWTNHL